MTAESLTASAVTHFTILLASAIVISIAAERLKLPAAVLLVFAGAVAGTLWHVTIPFHFGTALLFVFLPPLIFQAAWGVNLSEVRKHYGRILVLAFPGTLITAFAVAAAAIAVGSFSFPSALLLGAIVSATDPVAVVAVFRAIRVPVGVRTIVEGEALANDGVAVVMYLIALALVSQANAPWFGLATHGAVAVIMGLLLGAACAVPLWLALSVTAFSEYEIAGTVALAYASYLVASSLQWSGIFATAGAAISLRLLLIRRQHVSDLDQMHTFWNTAAYMTNSIVFLATGMLIAPIRIAHEPFLILFVLLAIFIVRAGLSFAVMDNWAGRVTVFLAGMRGALPLALVLALPDSMPFRAQIVDVVFAAVLVTLVFQGSTLRSILKQLDFNAAAGSTK